MGSNTCFWWVFASLHFIDFFTEVFDRFDLLWSRHGPENVEIWVPLRSFCKASLVCFGLLVPISGAFSCQLIWIGSMGVLKDSGDTA